MNFWELCYAIFGLITFAVLTISTIRAAPANARVIAIIAAATLITLSSLVWPVVYLIGLSVIFSRAEKGVDE